MTKNNILTNGSIQSEIRLDGKGHLNTDFYCQKFENIFLSNRKYKNILLYYIPNRAIGKTYTINNFLLDMQTLYLDKIYRIICLTPHPKQEYLVDEIFTNINRYYEITHYDNRDKITIYVVDDIDYGNEKFLQFLESCVWRNVIVVGFVN